MTLPLPPSPIVMADPTEEIGLVQGIMPDSINEWYTALALDRLRLDYTFQYSLGGGQGLRGGQVIDFVVWGPRGGIPVYVQGAYWHDIRHDPEGILKQAEAEERFKNAPVLLMEEETNTKDKAFQAVREKVNI